VVAVLGIAGTWRLVLGPTNKEEIVVEQTPSQEEWLAQLTPRDLKAYNENMAFGSKEYDTDYGFFKYEPGEFANPGAAIEIILADQQGTLLHPGDRVWRENLEIDKGTLRFKFMNGTVVTLSGKADLAITCPEMMQLKTGILLVDAGTERTIIRFENTDFIVRNAALGLLANPKAGRMDAFAVAGTVQVVAREDHSVGTLAAMEGVRITSDRRIRFQCKEQGMDLRACLLKGNKVVMSNKEGRE
jgi:hypothetical protein